MSSSNSSSNSGLDNEAILPKHQPQPLVITPPIDRRRNGSMVSLSSNASRSNHSSSAGNSLLTRAHSQISQIVTLPIKDRPLEQILAKPYGEMVESPDMPVSYHLDPISLKAAPRSFDRLGLQPWVPSVHSGGSGPGTASSSASSTSIAHQQHHQHPHQQAPPPPSSSVIPATATSPVTSTSGASIGSAVAPSSMTVADSNSLAHPTNTSTSSLRSVSPIILSSQRTIPTDGLSLGASAVPITPTSEAVATATTAASVAASASISAASAAALLSSSPRDRLSSLKGRTHSFPSAGFDNDARPKIQQGQPKVWTKPSPASTTGSMAIEEEEATLPDSSNISTSANESSLGGSNSAGATTKNMPYPLDNNVSGVTGNASATGLSSATGNASLVGNIPGNGHPDTQYFFDVAAPPLAFYRHVPRIFGCEPPFISGHTCTLVNNKIYIFGGKTPNGHSDKLYVFNCTTNLLSCPKLLGEVPPPVRDLSAVSTDEFHIYFFGGQDEIKYYNSLYALDVRSFRFRKLEPQGARIPEPRAGHSCVLQKIKTSNSKNETFSVNYPIIIESSGHRPATVTSKSSPATSTRKMARTSSSTTTMTSTLFIFGGASNDRTCFNDVWKLHISPDNPYDVTFSEVISLDRDTVEWPSARVNHTAHNSQNNGMLIYGGNDFTNRVFKSLWMFDFALEKWHKIADSARPRTLHMSELVDDRLIVVGGHDGERCNVVIDIFNLKTKVWHSRICNGMQSSGQCFHRGAYFDCRTYIVGGLDPVHILAGLRIIEMPNIKL